MKWISFVSQTGGEILELSKYFNKTEVTIATNHPERLLDEVKQHFAGKIIELPKKPEIEDYYNLHLEDYDIITLNGYLRIIPGEIADKYLIFNGHPGLINVYPELKGKDPQKRAFEGHYDTIGSVVHNVTAGVDEGEVIFHSFKKLDGDLSKYTLDDYFSILKDTSFDAWKNFLLTKGIE